MNNIKQKHYWGNFNKKKSGKQINTVLKYVDRPAAQTSIHLYWFSVTPLIRIPVCLSLVDFQFLLNLTRKKNNVSLFMVAQFTH